MRSFILATAAVPLILLAGCQNKAADDNDTVVAGPDNIDKAAAEVGDTPAARAQLFSADGEGRGEALITEENGALKLRLNVAGLPAGEHGAHIHAVGQCAAPEFKSAGGHWNPGDKKHGLQNPDGHHQGDFPNLMVASDGTGMLEATIDNASFKGGANALLDADGAAFVIHSGADDQRTDPSGDSGERIACGIFEMRGG